MTTIEKLLKLCFFSLNLLKQKRTAQISFKQSSFWMFIVFFTQKSADDF